MTDTANVDVAQMSRRLFQIKEKQHAWRTKPSSYAAATEAAFRKGVESKRKAVDVLTTSTIRTPYAPNYVMIERPFLIRAYRQGRPNANIITFDKIAPLNSQVQFMSQLEDSGHFLKQDEVCFYFLWHNDSTDDAVVNVESSLMLIGAYSISANSGALWFPLFLANSTIGKIHLSVHAVLSLFEWWNDPPTEPLQQTGQLSYVVNNAEVSGDFTPQYLGTGLNIERADLSGTYYVHYNGFLVPAGQRAVFEVTLRISGGGYDGYTVVRCSGGQEMLLCPFVQLEIPTAPIMVSG